MIEKNRQLTRSSDVLKDISKAKADLSAPPKSDNQPYASLQITPSGNYRAGPAKSNRRCKMLSKKPANLFYPGQLIRPKIYSRSGRRISLSFACVFSFRRSAESFRPGDNRGFGHWGIAFQNSHTNSKALLFDGSARLSVPEVAVCNSSVLCRHSKFRLIGTVAVSLTADGQNNIY
jgi:hypothetical protein